MSCSNFETSAATASNPIFPLTPPPDRPGPIDASLPFPGGNQAAAIHSCRFEQLLGDFTSCSLPPGCAVPDWIGGAFICFCHSTAETSILCATELVPIHVTGDRDWQLFHVTESPGLSYANLLAAFILPLKSRQVDVITIAGSHGFCFLIRRHALPTALMALQEGGHQFVARAGVENIPVAFLAT
jgi:hypothetical protein